MWLPKAKRYAAWKDYVAKFILLKVAKEDFKTYSKLADIYEYKPIKYDGKKACMDIYILFANKAHGDPDNIFKGIADALFVNDKFLSGSFDFGYDKESPRVEVRIKTDLSTEKT